MSTSLADSISDETARKGMPEFRRLSIPAEVMARSILLAITQPDDVNISEIIVRPTASPYLHPGYFMENFLTKYDRSRPNFVPYQGWLLQSFA